MSSGSRNFELATPCALQARTGEGHSSLSSLTTRSTEMASSECRCVLKSLTFLQMFQQSCRVMKCLLVACSLNVVLCERLPNCARITFRIARETGYVCTHAHTHCSQAVYYVNQQKLIRTLPTLTPSTRVYTWSLHHVVLVCNVHTIKHFSHLDSTCKNSLHISCELTQEQVGVLAPSRRGHGWCVCPHISPLLDHFLGIHQQLWLIGNKHRGRAFGNLSVTASAGSCAVLYSPCTHHIYSM